MGIIGKLAIVSLILAIVPIIIEIVKVNISRVLNILFWILKSPAIFILNVSLALILLGITNSLLLGVIIDIIFLLLIAIQILLLIFIKFSKRMKIFLLDSILIITQTVMLIIFNIFKSF